ncbi:hypothetical protein D3OALGA1CA_986 [Olavius algarvensis associated proteobacterium Delta 3]|nr:hypothetical protein D3OALGA1CA_986 [Olavius algarvensis associated proteobacterium Delta 3]CAB5130201.1 hypothetical protein D3OALGB2SA_3573 [Olavius algarvensis associated proteobacterium Delta 3]
MVPINGNHDRGVPPAVILHVGLFGSRLSWKQIGLSRTSPSSD